MALFLGACDTEPEALDLQPLKEYTEEYYQALRDYKASAHEVCYVYYADWAPIEGASGYKDPASWGERIIGLPDSIDLVNLWMGIPTPDTHPVAYKDMIETREKKGTRFIFHADASNYNHRFTVDGRYYDLSSDRSEEAIRAYARWVCDTVIETGLDGADFDYEGWNGQHLTWAIEECDKIFGPQGSTPSGWSLWTTSRYHLQWPVTPMWTTTSNKPIASKVQVWARWGTPTRRPSIASPSDRNPRAAKSLIMPLGSPQRATRAAVALTMWSATTITRATVCPMVPFAVLSRL